MITLIYITGDTHGDLTRIRQFSHRMKLCEDDIIIILGDVGINYNDNIFEKCVGTAGRIEATLFCIHGNHERRPIKALGYRDSTICGGKVMIHERLPRVKFALDGEVYNFDCNGQIKKTLVIGGAFSVDKYIRLANGYPWFEDEQPSEEIKRKVENVVCSNNGDFNIILTHTCPYQFRPTEVFDNRVDESLVDCSTEKWLSMIYSALDMSYFEHWYCGHFHINKTIIMDNLYGKKLTMLFDDFVELK